MKIPNAYVTIRQNSEQFVLLTGNSFIDLHYQTRIADIRDSNDNLPGNCIVTEKTT